MRTIVVKPKSDTCAKKDDSDILTDFIKSTEEKITEAFSNHLALAKTRNEDLTIAREEFMKTLEITVDEQKKSIKEKFITNHVQLARKASDNIDLSAIKLDDYESFNKQWNEILANDAAEKAWAQIITKINPPKTESRCVIL